MSQRATAFTAALKPKLATLTVPTWTRAWIGDYESTQQIVDGLSVTRSIGASGALVRVAIDHARLEDADAFKNLICRAHGAIRDAVLSSPQDHIVRLWNFIPGIHDAMGDACDRYMAFNIARYESMRGWFGSDAALRQHVPAASGVGHSGDALVICALAIAEAGRVIDNPSQIPAFRYSQHYGPLPPCFARATRIDSPTPALFIAGTAAILGEKTQFDDNLSQQWQLTLQNLRTVIANGWPALAGDPLDALYHARIYLPNDESMATIHQLSRKTFGHRTQVELIRADLCRRDLLVEIEGTVFQEPTRP